MGNISTQVGDTLLSVIFWYQFGLLLLFLGGNVPVFLLYLFRLFRWKKALSFRWLWIALEVIYGFCNPVVYLTTLQVFWSNRFLNGAAVVCLIAYWATRFCLPARTVSKKLKLIVQCNLVACFIVLSIFTVKDTLYFVKYVWGTVPGAKFVIRDFDGGLHVKGALLLFYIIPFMILLFQILKAWSSAHWQGEPSYLLLTTQRFMPYIPVALCIGGVLCVLPFLRHHQEADVRKLVLQHRTSIIQASQTYNLDPRVVASVIYVNHREYISPSRYRLENLLMTLWLKDRSSHYGLSETLNISLGVCQIKPVTALTSLVIPCWNENSKHCLRKDFRDVPFYIQENWMLTNIASLEVPLPFKDVGKPTVVKELLTPEKNIEYCAYILALYASQWEDVHQEWSIRARPDILATLYQIGFEKSVPKPQPQANTFGRRVQHVYETEWMIQHFQDSRIISQAKGE